MTRREPTSRAPAVKSAPEALLAELAALADDSLRQKFLARHRTHARHESVEQLARMVVEKVRVDTREALRLADAAQSIARRLRRKESVALGLRAKANALYASGDNRSAV